MLWEIYIKKIAELSKSSVKYNIYIGSSQPSIDDEWFPELQYSKYKQETDYLFAYYEEVRDSKEYIVASSYGIETSVTRNGDTYRCSNYWLGIKNISYDITKY